MCLTQLEKEKADFYLAIIQNTSSSGKRQKKPIEHFARHIHML